MLTLLNLPREIRNDFGSILLLGIIPGNGSQEPKNLDPYLEVFIDELLLLSGSTLFDAYQSAPFQLKVDVLLYVLDYPGLGKALNMSGSGAYKGCMWCDIKGTHKAIIIVLASISYVVICMYNCISVYSIIVAILKLKYGLLPHQYFKFSTICRNLLQ